MQFPVLCRCHTWKGSHSDHFGDRCERLIVVDSFLLPISINHKSSFISFHYTVTVILGLIHLLHPIAFFLGGKISSSQVPFLSSASISFFMASRHFSSFTASDAVVTEGVELNRNRNGVFRVRATSRICHNILHNTEGRLTRFPLPYSSPSLGRESHTAWLPALSAVPTCSSPLVTASSFWD